MRHPALTVRQDRRPTAARLASAATLLVSTIVTLMLVLAPLTLAQNEGSRFQDRSPGQHVFDPAGVLDEAVEQSVEERLQGQLEDTGIDVVVYVKRKQPVGSRPGARSDARALLEAWGVGEDDGPGAAMVWNLNNNGNRTASGVAITDGLVGLDAGDVDDAVNIVVGPLLKDRDWAGALSQGVVELENQVIPTVAAPTAEPTRRPTSPGTTGPLRPQVTDGQRPTTGIEAAAGPPYPDALPGVRVYDYAEVIDASVIASLSESIARIEERTGAQIVVYTQIKPDADSADQTEQDAIDLIDQWGVGREGFDDGLAIFFNLVDDKCHGQVQLYAAPGFNSAYLTNEERQAVFENDMLPALRRCDFNTALTAAIARVDETATAEHANSLQLARQIDAVAGLIVAPLLLIGLVAWAGWSWLRYGRDPVYLDDPSILMPAPPPGLSPAAGAVIIEGAAKRRALTTALVDLASRGEIDFRAAEGKSDEVSIDITVPDQRDARLTRNRRQDMGPAEKYALTELKKLGGAKRTIEADDVPKFSKAVDGFNERVEDLVAERGWFREPPKDSVERWSRRAAVILIAGIAGVFFGINLPSSGLLLVGAAAVAAAIAMFVIARTMPQRTMEGARMYAQLAAYRRTLQKTLEQARTMDQVVSSGVLPWVETPDQALVWSYSLGLHEEAEEVLERSMEDVRTGDASPTRTYFPLWYSIGDRSGARISGGTRAPTAGLFSSGVVPDFTAMTSALSTIGNAPASSGGGGGFGGGGSGGGGGGAGGGF
jgi:uncharacterized membrane protein YgcG